jgi:hypothetical protein
VKDPARVGTGSQALAAYEPGQVPEDPREILHGLKAAQDEAGDE